MRLQRLTNLEILTLRNEYAEVLKRIKYLESILKSEKKLISVIRDELMEIREKYADARRTQLVGAFEEAEIVPDAPAADEAVVCMTRAGFVKRMQPKLFEKSVQNGEVPVEPPYRFACETTDKLLFFTDQGNCYPVMVSQVPECRVKDRGLPLGGLLAGLAKGENVVSLLCVKPSDFTGELLFVSRGGLVKRVDMAEYNINRARLSGESNLLMITEQGMAIHFRTAEVSLIGRTAAGVKGIALAPEDGIGFVLPDDEEGEVLLVSDKGFMKRCLLIDFDLQARAGKGVKCFAFQKNGANGTRICAALLVKQPFDFVAKQKSGQEMPLNTNAVRIERRDSRGSMYAMCVLDDTIEFVEKTIQRGN